MNIQLVFIEPIVHKNVDLFFIILFISLRFK